MSNRPVQVLSDSEIPSEVDTGRPSVFESEFINTDIPELTQSEGSKSQDINRYHCIKTNGSIDRTPYNVQSEKIGDIIKRLDVQTEYDNDNNNDNDNEVLTRKQFATSMTDMRNDILSMINLLGCLNSSYTASETELRHIKKDLYKVVQENAHLKKKINEMKSSNEKHYNTLANCYEQRFKRIFKRLNIKDTDSKQLFNSSNRGQTSNNNRYIDSQQEKKTNKFKVVPKRTLKKGRDKFGDNDTEEFTMSESSTQPIRRDRYEDTSKNSSDGREYRMKRLRFRRFDC
jgi:hypothetical protein